MRERSLELSVMFGDETFRPFVGEVRILSPGLAAKLERAALDDHTVDLDERETECVSSAAQALLRSALVKDPELDHIAEL